MHQDVLYVRLHVDAWKSNEMEKVWREPDEDIKSLKSLLLFGLRGIAAYAYHAMVLGYNDEEVNRFFYKGMSALGQDRTMENLLSIVMETGAVILNAWNFWIKQTPKLMEFRHRQKFL